MSTRKALYVGLGAGAVLMGFAIILLFVAMGEPQLNAEEQTALRPIAPGTGAPPPAKRKSLPEPPRPPPPSPAEAPPERSHEERAQAAYTDAFRLLGAKQYPQALIAAMLCSEFTPKNADCHKLAGDAYTGLGEKEKAAAEYRVFLSMAPRHEHAAEVRQALGLTPSPRSSARVSPSSSSEGGANMNQHAAAKLVRSKQYNDALVLATRCVEQDPKNAECHMLVGASFAGLGNYDRAVQYYRSFLGMAPDHRLAPRVRETLEKYESSR